MFKERFFVFEVGGNNNPLDDGESMFPNPDAVGAKPEAQQAEVKEKGVADRQELDISGDTETLMDPKAKGEAVQAAFDQFYQAYSTAMTEMSNTDSSRFNEQLPTLLKTLDLGRGALFDLKTDPQGNPTQLIPNQKVVNSITTEKELAPYLAAVQALIEDIKSPSTSVADTSDTPGERTPGTPKGLAAMMRNSGEAEQSNKKLYKDALGEATARALAARKTETATYGAPRTPRPTAEDIQKMPPSKIKALAAAWKERAERETSQRLASDL